MKVAAWDRMIFNSGVKGLEGGQDFELRYLWFQQCWVRVFGFPGAYTALM